MDDSSIENGGIGTKCAETTTWKKCAKIPRSNISGMCGMSGMPRSNVKVKYFRNAKVKCQGQIFQECQGQMLRSNAKVKCQGQISQGQMGNRKKPEKTGKMGNGKMGKCNKNKKP